MDVFRTRLPQSIQALSLSTKGRFFNLHVTYTYKLYRIYNQYRYPGKRRQGLTIQPDMFDIVTM